MQPLEPRSLHVFLYRVICSPCLHHTRYPLEKFCSSYISFAAPKENQRALVFSTRHSEARVPSPSQMHDSVFLSYSSASDRILQHQTRDGLGIKGSGVPRQRQHRRERLCTLGTATPQVRPSRACRSAAVSEVACPSARGWPGHPLCSGASRRCSAPRPRQSAAEDRPPVPPAAEERRHGPSSGAPRV